MPCIFADPSRINSDLSGNYAAIRYGRPVATRTGPTASALRLKQGDDYANSQSLFTSSIIREPSLPIPSLPGPSQLNPSPVASFARGHRLGRTPHRALVRLVWLSVYGVAPSPRSCQHG